jgi:hypothetical protein
MLSGLAIYLSTRCKLLDRENPSESLPESKKLLLEDYSLSDVLIKLSSSSLSFFSL